MSLCMCIYVYICVYRAMRRMFIFEYINTHLIPTVALFSLCYVHIIFK